MLIYSINKTLTGRFGDSSGSLPKYDKSIIPNHYPVNGGERTQTDQRELLPGW